MALNGICQKAKDVFFRHGSYDPLTTTEFVDIGIVNKYFLPHHALIRCESGSTNLRVVSDGSSEGCCICLKGYRVQSNLCLDSEIFDMFSL